MLTTALLMFTYMLGAWLVVFLLSFLVIMWKMMRVKARLRLRRIRKSQGAEALFTPRMELTEADLRMLNGMMDVRTLRDSGETLFPALNFIEYDPKVHKPTEVCALIAQNSELRRELDKSQAREAGLRESYEHQLLHWRREYDKLNATHQAFLVSVRPKQ